MVLSLQAFDVWGGSLNPDSLIRQNEVEREVSATSLLVLAHLIHLYLVSASSRPARKAPSVLDSPIPVVDRRTDGQTDRQTEEMEREEEVEIKVWQHEID